MQIHLYRQDAFFPKIDDMQNICIEFLIDKDNTLLIASYVETLHLVKNIVTIQCILSSKSFP